MREVNVAYRFALPLKDLSGVKRHGGEERAQARLVIGRELRQQSVLR
jgi:hypothetical protein